MAASMQVFDIATAKKWFEIIEDGVPEDMALLWLEREATGSAAPKEYRDSWQIAIEEDCLKTRSLNKAECIALKMYTMEEYKFYRKFNGDCRERKWKCYKVYTSLLQSGLSKLRRKSSEAVRKLYRGLSCNSLDAAATGLCMPGFTSTSSKFEIAKKFSKAATITVESRYGSEIDSFSKFAEKETLFSPFQVFEVLIDKSLVNDRTGKSLARIRTCFDQTIPFLLFPHFRGSLLGAVVGNCIGAPFEFQATPTIDALLTKLGHDGSTGKSFFRMRWMTCRTASVNGISVAAYLSQFLKNCCLSGRENNTARKGSWKYTSDTSMILALADSLVRADPLNIMDLRKSLSAAYMRDRNRRFGRSAATILEELHRQTPTDDPFAPAQRVQGGAGSNGNGGAMRIVPAALLNWNVTKDKFKNEIEQITRLTHSNISGVNGALLQAIAVQEAITFSIYEKRDHTIHERYIDGLIEKMQMIETSENRPYCDKLKAVKGFLSTKPPPETVQRELGQGISAITSVSTAIYCFLRGMHSIPGIPESRTEFERTTIYAISLGGDTDTIASMAGAIAGAYYGQDSIPQRWRDICEAKAIDDAKRYAKEIHGIVFKN